MKTSRALALAALGALAVSGAVHCEPSVLDGNLLEDHVSVGIVNDLPAEIMQELTKHVHEFLEEIRPGIHEGIQKEIFEFKIDPELEALTVAESYFENPETSVLAERMLSVCESDMKNCPLLQHLPEEERVASKVVYSAGFFLTSGGPDCTALLGQHCADFGKRFCLNISAPFIAQFFGEALDATMPFVDILFANETEAAALGEARGWGSDVATVALKCCDLPKASGRRARCVVFTQGADSTIVACEGAVTTYPVTPLAKELLVDTNGAGDAFVGGFLSRLVLGEGWDACVKAGHYAAREIIQRPGCTVPDTCGYGSFF